MTYWDALWMAIKILLLVSWFISSVMGMIKSLDKLGDEDVDKKSIYIIALIFSIISFICLMGFMIFIIRNH